MLAPLGGGTGEWQLEPAEQPTRRLHVGFWAPTHELVDAFWSAGIDAGYRSDGEPGPRPQYRDDYYGGFLLDPDGNSAEAVFHGAEPRVTGQVDHLWIRVADLAEAKGRFAPAAARAGFAIAYDEPDRVQFRQDSCSFSIVPGQPTANVDLGFLTIP